MDNYKLLDTHTNTSRQEEVVLGTGPSYMVNSIQGNIASTRERASPGPPAPTSSPEQREGGDSARQREVEDLIRRLEDVTEERDALRTSQANQERVQAMHESRIKRLEQQLVRCLHAGGGEPLIKGHSCRGYGIRASQSP